MQCCFLQLTANVAQQCQTGTGAVQTEGCAATHGYSDDVADQKAAKSKGRPPGRCSSRVFLASAVPKMREAGTGCLDPARSPRPQELQYCFLQLLRMWLSSARQARGTPCRRLQRQFRALLMVWLMKKLPNAKAARALLGGAGSEPLVPVLHQE